jgi:hypothetical protein
MMSVQGWLPGRNSGPMTKVKCSGILGVGEISSLGFYICEEKTLKFFYSSSYSGG